jgi:hypothetical protein
MIFSLTISDLATIAAFILGVVNIYLYLLHRKETLLPVIRHRVKGLPPYRTENHVTTIKIINVGNAVANLITTHLEASWDDDLTILLEYPYVGNVKLAPKKDAIIYTRLPVPNKPGDYTYYLITAIKEHGDTVDPYPFRIPEPGETTPQSHWQ